MSIGTYAHKGSYEARAVLDLTHAPTQAAAGARSVHALEAHDEGSKW